MIILFLKKSLLPWITGDTPSGSYFQACFVLFLTSICFSIIFGTKAKADHCRLKVSMQSDA